LTGPIAPGQPGSPPSISTRADPGATLTSQSLHTATPDHRVAKIDRNKVDPQVLKAAEGFEALFLDQLMKTMRQTVPKNEMDLENGATEIYRGMLDSEYAQKAVHAGGVGLADQIIAYLDSQSYTSPQGSKEEVDPRTRTGGTHEGQ
jgi:Rod binding domain-containing protein